MRPIARLLAEEGNNLDKQSRRMHRLAERVNAAEIDQSALQAMMVEYDGPKPVEEDEKAEWPCPDHDKFMLNCSSCHTAWKTQVLFNQQTWRSSVPSTSDGRVSDV